MIRVFVGSDPRQEDAEAVLEYSIKQHTSESVEIVWMRHGDSGFNDWSIGRPAGPSFPKSLGWGTDFACFRMAIPELCGFAGKAIYLDSDMLLLADLAELWSLSQRRPWLSNSVKIMDVCMIRCDAFKNKPWCPSIEEMKLSGSNLISYRRILDRHSFIDTTLSWDWNCRDGEGYELNRTKLIHFTRLDTQPWHPWPERISYLEHEKPEVSALWHRSLEEARAASH